MVNIRRLLYFLRVRAAMAVAVKDRVTTELSPYLLQVTTFYRS